MAESLSNYQCPACTGPLHYDGASGKMVCDYCGSSFTTEEIEKLHKKPEEQTPAQETKPEPEAAEYAEDGFQSFSCPSCGAELVCDETLAATSCPYCGNPTVVRKRLEGEFKPDLVVPFKLEKQNAIDLMKNFMKGKKLLPPKFRSEHTLSEIKGVYIPYWIFDTNLEADAVLTGEIRRAWSDSDYNYVEISHYELNRSGHMSFRDVPVDGLEKLDNKVSESIEPFDVSRAVPFSPSYLAGFLADRYDVDAVQAAPVAEARIRNTAQQAIAQTAAEYSNVAFRNSGISMKNLKPRYALLPVWIMHVEWENKQYLFAVNGQTGKIVGELPTSKKLYWKYRLIYAAIIAVVLYIIQWIFALM